MNEPDINTDFKTNSNTVLDPKKMTVKYINSFIKDRFITEIKNYKKYVAILVFVSLVGIILSVFSLANKKNIPENILQPINEEKSTFTVPQSTQSKITENEKSLDTLLENTSVSTDEKIAYPKVTNELTDKTTDILSIIFTGDIMLDRYIREMAEKNGYDFIFKDVSDTLNSADLVVANLEGPITEYESLSKYTKAGSKENYIFTFDPKVTKVLKANNIKVVNIGNNHIGNFGSDGVTQTIKYLDDASIDYFGDIPQIDKPTHTFSSNGLTITLINYNEFSDPDSKHIIEEIKKYDKKSDLVVIFAHWGVEYETVAVEKYVELAHIFVDSGADLIIGSHPHVVQQSEVYNDVNIYYSLGNFIMDQYFDKDVMQGLLVKVIINKNDKKLSIEEIKTKLNTNGQTLIVKQENQQ